ncbi:diaminobutyrate acetyltransferase [Vibrio sp. TH_r3]|uniref:diaminobutyrate acetyltransferase n=1 Tax=Vibrio sp. TH_r3 TaxID=3082084 RepID=UPI003985AFC7
MCSQTARESFGKSAIEGLANSISWQFSVPSIKDGLQVNRLIAESPPLDTNSAYCNFLQTTHFQDTSIVAYFQGELAGFISGYLKPNDPKTLFIWQVAVASKYRGQGLAKTMLSELRARNCLRDITAIETTITKDNNSSWALFKTLERESEQESLVSVFLDKELDFKGLHDTEYLYRLPLTPHNETKKLETE